MCTDRERMEERKWEKQRGEFTNLACCCMQYSNCESISTSSVRKYWESAESISDDKTGVVGMVLLFAEFCEEQICEYAFIIPMEWKSTKDASAFQVYKDKWQLVKPSHCTRNKNIWCLEQKVCSKVLKKEEFLGGLHHASGRAELRWSLFYLITN